MQSPGLNIAQSLTEDVAAAEIGFAAVFRDSEYP
jgi:hypothetical protein